jgi:polyphosphate kinase
LKQRVREIFNTLLRDNTSARIMQSDGSYKREKNTENPFNAQEYLYQCAYNAAEEE